MAGTLLRPTTVTTAGALATLPCTSVRVRVMGTRPRSAQLKNVRLRRAWAMPQASKLPASTWRAATDAVSFTRVTVTLRVRTTGGVTSFTVTQKLPRLVLPAASVAVTSTVLVPTAKAWGDWMRRPATA